jgi:hypothetical protein
VEQVAFKLVPSFQSLLVVEMLLSHDGNAPHKHVLLVKRTRLVLLARDCYHGQTKHRTQTESLVTTDVHRCALLG